MFYFGGLLAMPAVRTGELAELLGYCRQRGIVTVVDVVVPQGYSGMEELSPLLPQVDYFLPNDDEARRLTGCADVEEQACRLLACGGRHGGHHLRRRRVRGGPRPAALAAPSASASRGIDPSGSGDAFAAGVITGILRGWDMAETLRYAAVLGASATTAIGTTDGVFNARRAAACLREHALGVTHSEREG